MKKLKKVNENNLSTIEKMNYDCVCRQPNCGGCSGSQGMFEAQADAYYASTRLSIRGGDPW